MKTYRVKYTVYLKDGSFSNRETLVKKSFTAAHAMVRLEGYVKRKTPQFSHLHVYDCREDILSQFGDIFGRSF